MKKVLIFSTILLIISCSSTKTSLTENGEEGKGYLRNNLKQGKWNFYQDGHLSSIGHYSENKKTGTWKYFHSNGKIHQKGNFTNDKQNGIWNYYFENGEFMGSGELINDNQNGLWKWYHENGNLYTERLYDNGKLLEIKSCFDKSSKALDCGKIINGNGTMLFHDMQNESVPIQKLEFENGIIKKYK